MPVGKWLISPSLFAIFICSSSDSWLPGRLTLGVVWYTGILWTCSWREGLVVKRMLKNLAIPFKFGKVPNLNLMFLVIRHFILSNFLSWQYFMVMLLENLVNIKFNNDPYFIVTHISMHVYTMPWSYLQCHCYVNSLELWCEVSPQTSLRKYLKC